MIQERFWGSTYIADDESKRIMPLLCAAVDNQRMQQDYTIPYSYWTDKNGWLYIKWNVTNLENKPVIRYRFDESGKLIAEAISEKLTHAELLRGKGNNAPVVLITGDTHRDFKRIVRFCECFPTTKDDVMIILGDAGINYYSDIRDEQVKERLAALPITLFCIYGNHEVRPEAVGSYRTTNWHGGEAYIEDRFHNLIFAKDGEMYDIAGKKTLVIGGAYSVDKWYRLKNHYHWFEDEQPSPKIKAHVEETLNRNNWKVDVVLSHTTPYQYRPTDLFIPMIDQSTVDSSTEKWLRDIEERLDYNRWYAGHFHCDRKTDKMQIMYRNVELFCCDRELDFSME